MSFTSSHTIPSLRQGYSSQHAGKLPTKSVPNLSRDLVWQNAVAFISLATVGAIVAYLILMR
jgi:hypothetical protein